LARSDPSVHSYSIRKLGSGRKCFYIEIPEKFQVKVLISKKADVNTKKSDDYSLAHIAVKYGHLKVLQYLASKGI
jgi:ankyrin repeat protein